MLEDYNDPQYLQAAPLAFCLRVLIQQASSHLSPTPVPMKLLQARPLHRCPRGPRLPRRRHHQHLTIPTATTPPPLRHHHRPQLPRQTRRHSRPRSASASSKVSANIKPASPHPHHDGRRRAQSLRRSPHHGPLRRITRRPPPPPSSKKARPDTIQNIFYSAQIMHDHHWSSAEIVSSPSHLPRAAFIASTFDTRIPPLAFNWHTHPACGHRVRPGPQIQAL